MGRNCQYLPPILPCPPFNISLSKVKTLWGCSWARFFKPSGSTGAVKAVLHITWFCVVDLMKNPLKNLSLKLGPGVYFFPSCRVSTF